MAISYPTDSSDLKYLHVHYTATPSPEKKVSLAPAPWAANFTSIEQDIMYKTTMHDDCESKNENITKFDTFHY